MGIFSLFITVTSLCVHVCKHSGYMHTVRVKTSNTKDQNYFNSNHHFQSMLNN